MTEAIAQGTVLATDVRGELVDSSSLQNDPARLREQLAEQGHVLIRGAIDRQGVVAAIDAASGGIRIYARIVAPNLASPLRPGAFVDVIVPGKFYRGVLRLPDGAIMDDGSIYVVEDGRLAGRRAEFVSRVGGDVLVRADITEGVQVVTTRFPEIGPGIRVDVR